jgi:hypothetical protein
MTSSNHALGATQESWPCQSRGTEAGSSCRSGGQINLSDAHDPKLSRPDRQTARTVNPGIYASTAFLAARAQRNMLPFFLVKTTQFNSIHRCMRRSARLLVPEISMLALSGKMVPIHQPRDT